MRKCSKFESEARIYCNTENRHTVKINILKSTSFKIIFRKSCGNVAIPETITSGFTPICLYWTPMPDTLTLQAGQDTRREIYLISLDNEESVAQQNFDATASMSGDELLFSHTASWERVWQNGIIELEGDDLVLQKVVAGSFYYLYSNLPSMDTFSENNLFYGLSPGQ